jgi:hypothetical protein
MSRLLDRFGRPFTPRLVVPRAQKCRAYQFEDGFDTYSSISSRYENSGGSPTIGTAYRRFAPPSGIPGQGLYLPSGAWCRKNMKSTQQTWIPRIAYCPLSLSSGGQAVLTCYDGGASVNQVSIVVQNSGAIAAWHGWLTVASTNLGASSPGIIQPNLFYGIECYFVVSTTVGVVQVWVNGVEVLSLTGVNTAPTNNNYATAIQVADTSNPGCYVDDLRVWDNTGAAMNAPLTYDSRIIEKLPSGAGGLAQLTPNGASANWQCCDDNPPDGDSTYVSGAASGLIDEYTAPIAGFTAAPVMVGTRVYARKDDGATRSLEFGVTSGSASAASTAGAVNVGSSYAFFDGVVIDDPNTSAPWTAAAADAAGFWKEETA